MLSGYTRFQNGQKIGPYEIQRLLGSGGMGSVYLAWDASLDRQVAIKALDPKRAEDPGLVQRFQREAKAAARLNHPHIVQVHAVGEVEGLPYIVMEYVDGVPLDQLLAREGTLEWRRAMTLCGQVASALGRAHEQGVVHRDIKPANILLDRQGRARVTDFGVAKMLEAATKLTTDGMFIGTPQYMSPEQCGTGEIGPPSDLFSLGVTVYEMLSGRRPFDADTPAGLVRAITLENHAPLTERVPGLPFQVSQFVEALLAKETCHRYANAEEILVDLRRLKHGQSLLHATTLRDGTPDSLLLPPLDKDRPAEKTPRRWFTKKRVAIGAVVVLVLLMLAGRRDGETESVAAEAPAPVFTPGTAPGSGPAANPGRSAADLEGLFDRLDVNRDGSLDRRETDGAAQPVRRRLRTADANGDGLVTKQELRASMARAPGNLLDRYRQRMSTPQQPSRQ